MRINKQIAVITGASRGIGKAIAEYLASKNFKVALLARDSKALENVANTIIAKGGEAAFFATDVSNATQVHATINRIVQDYGHIDLLFNNAGILSHGTSDIADEDIISTLQINLQGAIFVAKYVAAQMKIQKSGYIINLSSIGGKIAASFAGVYAASKFGLSGFSEALTKELSAYNVKVTNLCPSMVATDMTFGRKFKPEDMIQISDITKTVEYLLSLSRTALPAEIVIGCMPFIEKLTHHTRLAYELD